MTHWKHRRTVAAEKSAWNPNTAERRQVRRRLSGVGQTYFDLAPPRVVEAEYIYRYAHQRLRQLFA